MWSESPSPTSSHTLSELCPTFSHTCRAMNQTSSVHLMCFEQWRSISWVSYMLDSWPTSCTATAQSPESDYLHQMCFVCMHVLSRVLYDDGTTAIKTTVTDTWSLKVYRSFRIALISDLKHDLIFKLTKWRNLIKEKTKAGSFVRLMFSYFSSLCPTEREQLFQSSVSGMWFLKVVHGSNKEDLWRPTEKIVWLHTLTELLRMSNKYI